MALQVKRRDASGHQLEMGKLIVGITRQRGGDNESAAGAVATAIQESALTNLRGGDRDSAGLFQQRPSMGWGSYAQITTPSYAIGKFLDQYLAFRRKGEGWLRASHLTQRSAHPSAPAQWYGEGVAFTGAFAGSGGDLLGGSTLTGISDVGAIGGGTTGVQPYEFSRGSADALEDTWTCARRLADETQWRFFARGGALWYVSDDWLAQQPAQYRVNEFTLGVVGLSFEFETRAEAAEATLRVLSRRYSILPGDVVELTQEGPGSGRWLVKEVRRSIHSQVADVALTRRRPRLPEPAASGGQSGGGISVGGSVQSLGAFGGFGDAIGGGDTASRIYQAAQMATSKGWPYSQANRTLASGMRTADCSSGVSWVLLTAGVPLPAGGGWGKWAPVSGSYLGWGQAGRGNRVTVWTNAGHIWIQFHGFPSWRFDTGGGSGGKLHTTARSTGGFQARHWSGT